MKIRAGAVSPGMLVAIRGRRNTVKSVEKHKKRYIVSCEDLLSGEVVEAVFNEDQRVSWALREQMLLSRLTDEDVTKARKLFLAIDRSATGGIGALEIYHISEQLMGRQISRDEAKRWVEHYDNDKNNEVGFAEFLSVWAHLKYRHTKNDEIREFFAQFDSRKTGKITFTELQLALSHLAGTDVSDKQVSEIFAAADTNQDGCVDLDEFRDTLMEVEL